MSLAEHHRNELYACAYRILLGTAEKITTPHQMSSIVRSVVSVVSAAGADAAQAWNLRQRSAISQRLPPEILGNCFRMLQFRELVRVTHVCRHWRTVALGEHELWASYSRQFMGFSAKGLAQLATMLERSRSVPFRLRMAYEYPDIDESVLIDLLRPAIWRMREYQGPARIFLAAHPENVTMQHLQSFDVDEHYISPKPFILPDFLMEDSAPVLQSVRVPNLSFDGVSATFRNLRNLTCYVSGGANLVSLFQHCPSLTSLQLLGIEQTTVLPECPLPASLQETRFLRCAAIDRFGAPGAAHHCSGVSTAPPSPLDQPGSAPSPHCSTVPTSKYSLAITPPMVPVMCFPRVAPRLRAASARTTNMVHRAVVLWSLAPVVL